MHMSLPSGVMQDWPHGAPVTLHTLATNMISISDNTATDHLLAVLGRENVERRQATMGHTEPARNRPFMSTLEMFRLKFTNEGRPAHRYATLDEAGKREMLRALAATQGRDTVEYADTVMLADKVEWFARTPDLVRAMDWFRTTSGGDVNAPVLRVLGVNPGVEIDKATWPYVGYKGGSETGVLNMTYLLRHRNGDWYAVSVSWMRGDGECDLARFAGLVERAIGLLAP
jgi:beta-lactamase class A